MTCHTCSSKSFDHSESCIKCRVCGTRAVIRLFPPRDPQPPMAPVAVRQAIQLAA